jgi:hypothetical protein
VRDDLRAAVSALGSGVGTAAWYALPDHVDSRQQRALIKAGIAGALAGWSLLTGPPLTGPSPTGSPATGSLTTGAPLRGPTWWDRSGLAARAAVLLGGAGALTALTVAAERGIHRLGERSAQRGAALPHTRNGVVFGVVGALMAFGAERAARRWPVPPPG